MRTVYRSNDQMCSDILAYYGHNAQMEKALKELSELDVALGSYMTDGPTVTSADEVIDEIAEVVIMIGQLKLMFGVSKVNDRIEYKLNRQMERIDEERKAAPLTPAQAKLVDTAERIAAAMQPAMDRIEEIKREGGLDD